LGSELPNGYFVDPTIYRDVPQENLLSREEIFGPVLALTAIEDLDHAVAATNSVDYGLSAAIYTRRPACAREFVRRAEVGRVSVNIPTTYNEPQVPNAGIKDSGRGEPENGDSGLRFYTRNKSVYERY